MIVKSAVVGLLSILTPQILGAVAAIGTKKFAKSWFRRLNLPFWNPPRAIFRPIWVILFFLNGIASFLVWRQGQMNTKINVAVALSVYAIQLFLSLIWQPIYFVFRAPKLAGFIIGVYTFFVLSMELLFLSVDYLAFKLTLPFVVWVLIGDVLFAEIYRRNFLNPKTKAKLLKVK
ncbi:hypothetical protein DSO57_1028382 [Entomophthora muscae]|uniref:Uncharacterized protein n=1 Tax=Entomophthora muscae TaxID=34485 RepID=A0ACC2T1Q3_9FUNG|nr:hypothetical protein DSO57_1028382 [Entomophthora muscae]